MNILPLLRAVMLMKFSSFEVEHQQLPVRAVAVIMGPGRGNYEALSHLYLLSRDVMEREF